MKTPAETLASRYRLAHNEMRNIDGLQPSEALDELLKYLLFKAHDESKGAKTAKKTQGGVRTIRSGLKTAMETHRSFIGELFRRPDFAMSDACLAKVHDIMNPVSLSELDFDIRSAALRSFLSPEIRKGLGIFLTPDQVVTEIGAFFAFKAHDRILDPACGSGTFLMAALSQAAGKKMPLDVIGIDKSPRMMLLSELNIGNYKKKLFRGIVADTLRHQEYKKQIPFGSVDCILTNPPFGVNVDSENYDLKSFATAMTGGRGARKQSSELLFVEQCMKLLKPDGWLAVILPKSAINAASGERARGCLDGLGAIRALLDLPPETFSATGTMTNTVVLFIQKFGKKLSPDDMIAPVVARLENVGFDNTGRIREGSQLPGLGRALRAAVNGKNPDARLERLTTRRAGQTFSNLPEIVKGRSGRTAGRKTVKLGDLVEIVSTGTTPPRASYADTGLFLVKVGNLTGSGINWIPRDRNFVDTVSMGRRYTKSHMILKPGDILLTSSAHSPKYIAKKVDVISRIPAWVGGKASYVGEVMLVRPDRTKIDPYRLAAYLRSPSVADEIQRMIRGQTAHLYPDDLLNLDVEKDILLTSPALDGLASLIKEEARIAERLNEISWQQLVLFDQISKQSRGKKLVA